MTQQHNERLSALMDDEQTHGESLDSLVGNAAQLAIWHRYQVAAAIFRDDIQVGATMDISQQVARAVAQEQPHQVRQRVAMLERLRGWFYGDWLKPAASFAVASSVAVITVLGVQNFYDPTVSSDPDSAVGSESVLQTIPLGGFANPVSFSQTQPNQAGNSSASDAALQRQYLQSFYYDHQQQLQLSREQLTWPTIVTPQRPADEPDAMEQPEAPQGGN